MTVKKENDKIKKYDWAIFAQSYFLLSKLACQELLSERENKYRKSNEHKDLYQPKDLYISILFNIKHGIEVFIKTLSIFAYGEYEEGHDTKILFDNVKDKILKLKLKPREEGFYNDVFQEDIDASLKDLEQIKRLILYFFELEFLKKKLNGDFVINDTFNDVLRYPVNKAFIRIDWATILTGRVYNDDIKEIFEKLNELDELFNKTSRLHSIISH